MFEVQLLWFLGFVVLGLLTLIAGWLMCTAAVAIWAGLNGESVSEAIKPWLEEF